MIILGIITTIGAFVSWFLMRPGGIYNKRETPQTPLPEPIIPVSNNVPTPAVTPVLEALSGSQNVYNVAYSLLGKHLTLNATVNAEVGCAQALSFVLKNCGYNIPQGGISSVKGLTDWMIKQGFKETATYALGNIIVGRSPTDAHIGVCGKEWIMSNSSNDMPALNLHKGKFEANFHLAGWKNTFPNTRYFVPV